MSYPKGPLPPLRLETDRLILRQWERSDLADYASLNRDADVMAYFPSVLSLDESEMLLRHQSALINERGWGIWAVVRKTDGLFVGSVGLHTPRLDLPFAPCVEVGWRLARTCWKQGYATEAAQAALAFGFETLDLPEIVAFTSLLNLPSQTVMVRLGMETAVANNFEHPTVPKDSPLRMHCLYRLSQARWRRLQARE